MAADESTVRAVLREMKADRIMPDNETYNELMRFGVDKNSAHGYILEMQKGKINPNDDYIYMFEMKKDKSLAEMMPLCFNMNEKDPQTIPLNSGLDLTKDNDTELKIKEELINVTDQIPKPQWINNDPLNAEDYYRMLRKATNGNEVYNIVVELKEKGFYMNWSSCNVLIKFAENKDELAEILNEYLEVESTPGYLFFYALASFVKDEHDIEEFWDELDKFSIVPDRKIYDCLFSSVDDLLLKRKLIVKGSLEKIKFKGELSKLKIQIDYEEFRLLTEEEKEEARKKIFLSLEDYNMALWKAKKPETAARIMKEIDESGLEKNLDTYSNYVGFLEDEISIRDMMNEIQTKGMMPTLAFYNSLMKFAVDESSVLKIFEEMMQLGIAPDTNSYNYLISANWNKNKIIEITDKIRESGLSLNNDTYLLLLKSARNESELISIRADMKRDGIIGNYLHYSVMIDLVRDENLALEIMAEIETKGVKVSVYFYNKYFNIARNELKAKQVFRNMKSKRVVPNFGIFHCLIDLTSDLDSIKVYLREMKIYDVKPSIFVFNKMFDLVESLDDAFDILDLIIRENLIINLRAIGQIFKLAKSETKALETFELLRKKGIEITIEIYNFLLKYVRNEFTIQKIIREMKVNGMPPTIYTYNCIIENKTYIESLGWKTVMEEDGIEADAITYTNIMRHCSDFTIAKKLLKVMKEKLLKPNVFTYHALIRLSDSFETGLNFLDEM